MNAPAIHWRANVRQALASLAAVRMRSLLALFGIVVGIGSVIAMISTSEIVREESLKQFRELGTDILVIRQRHVQGQRRRNRSSRRGTWPSLRTRRRASPARPPGSRPPGISSTGAAAS